MRSPPPSYTSKQAQRESSPPLESDEDADGFVDAVESHPASVAASTISTASTATVLPPYSGDSTAWNSSTKPTGSSANGPLDQLQLERNHLRDALATERARNAQDLAAAREKLRLLELDRDTARTLAEAPRRATAGIFKKAYSTDLMFLIDTTGSMQPHINAAKDQVRSIMADIKAAFLDEAEIRIAVVCYKDHGDMDKIRFHDFTESIESIKAFLDSTTASGGGDTPEDVLGGIKQVICASWKNQTRCMIHIADAPAHGSNLHDLGTADSWRRHGAEPHKLHYEDMMKQLITLKINYAFLRVNTTTDKMVLRFAGAYAAHAECNLYNGNRYYYEFQNSSLATLNAKRRARGSLMFEEAQLGTSYAALSHLVVQSVATSASRTAVRLSSSASRSAGRGAGGRGSKPMRRKMKFSGLGGIQEDGDRIAEEDDDVRLEMVKPQWSSRSWFNETNTVEGFSPEVQVHGANTLDGMMESDSNIKMSLTELTISKRAKPFAQGALRVACYARTAASDNRYVVKSSKHGGKKLAHLAEDMRCQALCKAFALEFNAVNAMCGEKKSVDFIVTTCLKDTANNASADSCLSLEPFIEGAYVKYNNNSGFVNENIPDDRFNQLSQAFSHFTFERSGGSLLVTDLQGVKGMMTDPAIHARDPTRFQLCDTNLGADGFKFFFATHTCNDICKRLHLESNMKMLNSDTKLSFRTQWPSMDQTACCSNKLCGRIVLLSSSKQSDQYPGHWCGSCFEQLHKYEGKWTCTASLPHHDFTGSKFFDESQGILPAMRCPEHRHVTVYEAEMRQPVSVNASFWQRLRGATKKRSSYLKG